MRTSSRSPVLLVSGAATTLMAGFHFFLPKVFSWETDLRHMPAELGWAVLSLNCFFSFLLLCAGVAAIASWWRSELRVSSSLTLAAFWCVNVAYQLLFPPPWPRTIAFVLLGFAVLVAALALGGLAASLRRWPQPATGLTAH